MEKFCLLHKTLNYLIEYTSELLFLNMEKHGSATVNLSRDKTDQKPLSTNFEEFIPWACRALQESFFPIITRSTQRKTACFLFFNLHHF